MARERPQSWGTPTWLMALTAIVVIAYVIFRLWVMNYAAYG
jgi:hypothetical protein